MNKALLLGAVVILVIVDLLTFHDFSEAHSMRDWLTLFASILVIFYALKNLSKLK